jgi:hypothetical protein
MKMVFSMCLLATTSFHLQYKKRIESKIYCEFDPITANTHNISSFYGKNTDCPYPFKNTEEMYHFLLLNNFDKNNKENSCICNTMEQRTYERIYENNGDDKRLMSNGNCHYFAIFKKATAERYPYLSDEYKNMNTLHVLNKLKNIKMDFHSSSQIDLYINDDMFVNKNPVGHFSTYRPAFKRPLFLGYKTNLWYPSPPDFLDEMQTNVIGNVVTNDATDENQQAVTYENKLDDTLIKKLKNPSIKKNDLLSNLEDEDNAIWLQ